MEGSRAEYAPWNTRLDLIVQGSEVVILDTGLGWIAGDPERVLIASGLGVSEYNINQVITCMNQLGTFSPSSVSGVRGLLDEYDTAETEFITLNTDGSGRRFLKVADVLEWDIDQTGVNYSITTELQRIRGKLMQYFSFCPIYGDSVIYGGTTQLIRS